MKGIFKCFVLSSILCFVYGNTVFGEDGPIVETDRGSVLGAVKWTPKGKQFYAFLGIPYAKPPVGNLRFKAPVTGDVWEGTLNATVDPPACLQPDFVVPVSTKGVEDCLTLNVYTPADANGAPFPVHVFLHGGGFFEGTIATTHYGPERQLDTTDLIIVYINYRLEALGFLSTGDSAASGNWGLLDQNLGLQWVRANIAAFGGNPDDVTLSGQSAGSASVHFHLLSPMSAGLFHRAIAESGSSLCPWAVEENPLYYAQRLGEKLNCPTEDTTALISCLTDQDASSIIIKGMDIELENLTLAYVPVIENGESGVFLTEDPLTLLREGRFNRVPMMMGVVRDEGALIYQFVPFLFETIDDKFFQEVVPFILTVLTDYRTNLINVSYAIKDEYYDIDVNDKDAVVRASLDLISDMFMKYWSVETIDLISAQGVSVYMYAYNYVGDFYWTNFTGGADLGHSIELVYLYNMTEEQQLTEKDTAFSERLLPLWTNFITQGNPTPSSVPQWLPTLTGETQYYDLNDEFAFTQGYEVERMEFWRTTVPAIVYAN